MSDLRDKVSDWLSKQGFPLEFTTAKAFASYGFRADQGAYVPDPKSGVLREIDVIASTENFREELTFRTSVVLECKWSKDKPWVVFTSRGARPTVQEWIAYIVGSAFSEAVLFKLADDPALQELHRNVQPQRFGFGGRQALADRQEKDQFYAAVQGVVSAAVSLAHRDDPATPDSATDSVLVHLVLPVVVIEGSLFEAYLDGADLRVEPVSQAYVRWRGFDGRAKPVIVQVVTAEQLNDLAEKMANYCEVLRYYAGNSADVVRAALRSKRWSDLALRAGKAANLLVPSVLRGFS